MSATHTDVVIVGGGLAAVRTAQALREKGFSGRVCIISEEVLAPYDRPPLSKKFLLGEAPFESIVLADADQLMALNLDLRLGVAADGLDPSARSLQLSDGSRLRYDRLVVATGASPVRIPALSSFANVHSLRTAADAGAIRELLRPGAGLAIVGAGFIGLEVASAAIACDCRVQVIEAGATPLAAVLGSTLGGVIQRWHERRGVRFACGVTVVGAEGGQRLERLKLSDGGTLAVDGVVVGVGQRPNVAWLDTSGLEVHYGLVCDAFGRTSDPAVFGVGDVVCRHSSGGCTPTRHWTATTEQARRVAALIVGEAARDEPNDDHYFWSDQHGSRIQFAGRVYPDGELRYEVGSGEDDRFLATSLRAGVATAVLGLGCPRDFLLHSADLRS